MRLLESLGLGLLLASVAIGLLTLWLHSTSGQALALRFPRFAALMQARALVLVLMLAGISLLVLGVFMNPGAAPSGQNPAQVEPAPSKMANLPAKPAPALVPVPVLTPMPTQAPAVQAPAPESSSAPLSVPETPVRPVQPVRQMPQPAPAPPPKSTAPEAVPQKKNIFSARCARLLEKVGAGEPMTPQEQHEMVSKCQ